MSQALLSAEREWDYRWKMPWDARGIWVYRSNADFPKDVIVRPPEYPYLLGLQKHIRLFDYDNRNCGRTYYSGHDCHNASHIGMLIGEHTARATERLGFAGVIKQHTPARNMPSLEKLFHDLARSYRSKPSESEKLYNIGRDRIPISEQQYANMDSKQATTRTELYLLSQFFRACKMNGVSCSTQ